MKMSKVQVLTVLIFSVIAAGCSKGDPAPSSTNIIPADNLAEAQKIAIRGEVHCTDPSQCSPAVGLLVGTTEQNVYQCTTFLVSDDIVATNSHCVPGDLKKAGSSCKDRITIAFPKLDGYPEMKVGCSQVLTASVIGQDLQKSDSSGKPNGNDNQKDVQIGLADYAFLKLDQKVQRPALELSRKGFTDNKTYRIIKVDPYNGNGIPEGYIHSETCKIIPRSVIAQASDDPRASIKTLGDCTVIHGNSGSPLIDSDGSVPGVAFETVDTPNQTLEFIGPNSSSPALLEAIAPMGFVTNYACLPLPVKGFEDIPAACQTLAPPVTGQEINQDLSKKVSADIAKLTKLRMSNLDPAFEWDVASLHGLEINEYGLVAQNPGATIILAVPRCIRDQAKLVDNDRNAATGFFPSGIDHLGGVPAWTITSGLNRYLQPGYRISEAPEAFEDRMVVHLDTTKASSGAYSLIEGDTSQLAQKQALYAAPLQPCSDQ